MPLSTHQIRHPKELQSCVVFASPHSGRDYSWRFMKLTQLDQHRIRSSEDAWVDRLFDCAPDYGVPFLQAHAPRAYVDLNRSPDELDPAVVEGAKRSGHNPRVASGLGVIPRVVAGGRPIYRGKVSMSEAQHRLDVVWHPYHTALRGLLAEARARFGRAVLVDCHSMPREALESTAYSGPRPEIVLGDRFGASAAGEVVDVIEAAFAAQGFVVVRNTPFAGAYVTQTYGRPNRQQHAVQVEIDRSLYMEEASLKPLPDFAETQARLAAAVRDIAAMGLEAGRLAAE